ncbi:hypothetical protein evm_010309 [Chilo suppressalis]|nr:hypothetical protein evm_010309 [Chilo suppressalis]
MKERKRVAWILLLLAVLFALCWMPYNIMQLLLDINAVNPKDLSMYLPYALFIGHANSAINPIVYCLMTRNFQRSARKLLCGRGVCQQTHFTKNRSTGEISEKQEISCKIRRPGNPGIITYTV